MKSVDQFKLGLIELQNSTACLSAESNGERFGLDSMVDSDIIARRYFF